LVKHLQMGRDMVIAFSCKYYKCEPQEAVKLKFNSQNKQCLEMITCTYLSGVLIHAHILRGSLAPIF